MTDMLPVADALRLALKDTSLTRAFGAHSALTAKLVEEAGADVVWASGLEIAASRGVPDANILSSSEVLEVTAQIAEAVRVPVLADCDSGFGSVTNVAHTVRSFEQRGVAGICIEDKLFPKLNSFAEGPQPLAPIEDFCGKIHAAVESRERLVILARIEALISGATMEQALLRAHAYAAAGADAILIHSKAKSPDEVFEFRERLNHDIPIVVVPTTYATVTGAELERRGFSMAIYANHVLRSSIRAIQDSLARIVQDGTTANIEEDIVPVSEVFRLQGLATMLETQAEFEARGRDIAWAAAGVAS